MGRLGNSKAVPPTGRTDLPSTGLPKLPDSSYQELFLKLTTDAIRGLLKIGLHVKTSNSGDYDEENPSRNVPNNVRDFLVKVVEGTAQLNSIGLTDKEQQAVKEHVTHLASILLTDTDPKDKLSTTIKNVCKSRSFAERSGDSPSSLGDKLDIFTTQWIGVMMGALLFEQGFLGSAIKTTAFDNISQINSCSVVKQKCNEVIEPVEAIINEKYLDSFKVRCANIFVSRFILDSFSNALNSLREEYAKGTKKLEDRIDLLTKLDQTLLGNYGCYNPIAANRSAGEVPIMSMLKIKPNGSLPSYESLKGLAEALGDIPDDKMKMEAQDPYFIAPDSTYLKQITSALSTLQRPPAR